MIDSGSGGGALTGQRAESLGLMLNELRFGLRADEDFGRTEGLESAALTLRLASRMESRSDMVLAESVESAETVGMLRGIKIARGLQSLGWTSQSCSIPPVCWALAPADALPQPITNTVVNAAIVVERNMPSTEEYPSMRLCHQEYWVNAEHSYDLQAQGQSVIVTGPRTRFPQAPRQHREPRGSCRPEQ